MALAAASLIGVLPAPAGASTPTIADPAPAGTGSTPASTTEPSSPLVDARNAVLAGATEAGHPGDGSAPAGSGAPAGAARPAAGEGCGGTVETVVPGPPRSGPVLVPSTYEASYDCVADTVTFRVDTTAAFDPLAFGAWTVLLDTDGGGLLGSASDNCHGGEQIAAVYQTGDGGFDAALLTMGVNCDFQISRTPASFQVGATGAQVTVSAVDLRALDGTTDVGRVAAFGWAGELSTLSELSSSQPGSPVPTTGHDELAIPDVGSYRPVDPTRVLDSRNGTGGRSTPLVTGEHLDFVGMGDLPAPEGLSAVVLHVAVVDAAAPTYVTLWPTGDDRPIASNINVSPGALENGLVVVKVGTGGLVSLFNHLGKADVVADVYGYFTSQPDPDGSYLTGVTPRRLLDTRDGTGLGRRTPLGPAEGVTVPVVGKLGNLVPTGSTAVVANITAVSPSAATFLRAWGPGAAPLAAVLNVDQGRTLPNMAVIPLAPDGTLKLDNASGYVDVVIDVLGYFRHPAAVSGTALAVGAPGRFVPAVPRRALDTRDETGGIRGALAQSPVDLQVAGRGGVPAHAQAVVLSVGAVDPTAPGFLTVYPSGGARPLSSNLNFVPGRTVANLVTAKVGDGGTVSLFNSAGRTDVIADVAGWIA